MSVSRVIRGCRRYASLCWQTARNGRLEALVDVVAVGAVAAMLTLGLPPAVHHPRASAPGAGSRTLEPSQSALSLARGALSPARNALPLTMSSASQLDSPGSPAAAGSPVGLTVTIPRSGSFTVSCRITTLVLTSGPTASGTLQAVMVTDTRNYYPGWEVTWQVSDFVGSGTAAGSTISGSHLGWMPFVPAGTLPSGASLGPTVAPAARPGSSPTSGLLAIAPPGSGFSESPTVLSARVTLDIPDTDPAGPYSATMTITYESAVA